MEKLCSVLGSLKDECNTLVTTFFPQIWQLLISKAVSGRAPCACVCINFALSLSLSLRIQTLFVVK